MQSFYLQQSICSIDTFTLVKHHPLYVSTGPVHNQSRQQDIIWTIDFSKNLNFWCLYFPDYCTTIHTLIDPEEHLTWHHVASWYEQPPQRLKKRATSHHLVEPMKPRGWVEKCLQPYNCCLAERSVFNWRCCSWVKQTHFTRRLERRCIEEEKWTWSATVKIREATNEDKKSPTAINKPLHTSACKIPFVNM